MAPAKGDTGFCETCGAQLFPDSSFCHQCGMKIIAQKEEEDTLVEKKNLNEYKLYKVYSVVSNFLYKCSNYDNLKVNWFVVNRQVPPIPFEQAIGNYAQLPLISRVNPENFIKQCFTLEEAESLKKYLTNIQQIKAVIEGCRLPVKGNACGFRDAPPPPGTDFILLHKKTSYNLLFKVEGIFNTKLADERIVGDDHSITVVSGISVKDIQKHLKEKEKEKDKIF